MPHVRPRTKAAKKRRQARKEERRYKSHKDLGYNPRKQAAKAS